MGSIGVLGASKAHELFGQPADIRWRNELPWHSRVAPERLDVESKMTFLSTSQRYVVAIRSHLQIRLIPP